MLYNKDFGTIELSQGLTTVIGGNCGLAPIPAPVKYRKEIFDFIEPCLGKAPTAFSIESFADYVEALKQIDLPLHVGSFIGAGSVKAAVKGYGKAPFTKKEMKLARDYIKEGLQAGAVGMSMGSCISRNAIPQEKR